ncbi:MAG: cadmium-translocating P-type ATPase [Clostridiales bacterium]|nr:cadmium-translocating P-type ATPase [Clostridiales bacterium]
MIKVIKITGLDCANCARELEEEIEKIEGVESVTVDFMAQKVIVDCDGQTLEKVIYCCNHFEEVKVIPEEQKVCGEKQERGRTTLKISGLCCANCARELEEELNKIDGVEGTVDFVNLKVILSANSAEGYEKAVYTITHFEDVKIVDENAPAKKQGVIKSHLRDIIFIAVATCLFVPAFVLDLLEIPKEIFALRIMNYAFYGVSYLLVGWKVLLNTAKNIVKGKIFDENFLMTIASVGAILLGIFAGDGFAEGVAVMLLYSLGELLQGIAVGSSRNSIAKLMDLKSQTATLIIDGEQKVVAPEELKVGDRILIKAGEKVPADCKIVKGDTSLDLKSLNGESAPRDVKAGDEILSGSINLSKVIEAEVVREYKNSAVAKILELVENSTAKKSKPEKFITKFAKYYTPAVCLAAVLVAALVPTVICAVLNSFTWDTYGDWIYKALNFLVISCPCALVISVPLSYFCGIGRCAKFGILVKGSTCLDSLAQSTVAAFDKTGTLTEGTFGIVKYSSERALKLATGAEKFSSHPIAAAFTGIESDCKIEDAQEIAGRGVKCICDGKALLCGNAALLQENGVEFEKVESLSTVVYVALDGKEVGFIEIDDVVKSGAKEVVAELKKQGIESAVMLTGDLKARAQKIAEEVGLDGFEAELLPDQKLEKATLLKSEDGRKLMYVGDGINDAPVMTAADCAVSMGKVGSDAAIEASDIVLVSDNLSLLPKGKKIAKGTRRIVVENIAGSLAVKAAIMALSIAITPFPLIISIVADVGVMLVAVLNAMRTSLIK